ncbi:MAG: histidine kinase [Gemmatimonadota bacterium]|nr:histidine kinase [Gemmatimonadota bacterium]
MDIDDVRPAEQRRACELDTTLLENDPAPGASRPPVWQPRPHFVFNALNAVSQLACAGDSTGAVACVTVLGDMFQRSLESGGRRVALGEELAFVPRYLRVEEARYRRPFPVAVESDAGLERALVPVFVLQPAVEDVVRHVVADDLACLSLSVRARAREGVLDVEVRATGLAGRAPATVAIGDPGLRDLRRWLDREYRGASPAAMLVRAPDGVAARMWVPLEFPARHAGAKTSAAARTGC